MNYHAEEQTLNLATGQMDYITFGSGAKTLILIQGLNTRGIKGTAASVARMYQVFAQAYTVYFFDRREEISGDITVGELAGDLASAMDALGIANADVFGVSQGGMIAQYLAIKRPDLVHKLVLAVTTSRCNETLHAAVCDWIAMAERGAWEKLVEDMLEKMYSETYVQRYRPALSLLTALQKPTDVPRFIALAKSCLSCDTYDELDRIRCPVFVIGASRDRVVTGSASEEMAQKLACPIHMYENLGHAAYAEAQDFNQRVFDYFMA